MGIMKSKDPNVDIYVELNKQIYVAGEYVEGNIYLNIKGPAQYDVLYIRMEGQQYVYWSQGSGRNRRTYTNERKTYSEEFAVTRFDGCVNPGHYTFPFSFLLPNMLSGSFYHSQNNYIKYDVMGYLASLRKKKDNQEYSIPLNIMEPIRGPIGPVRCGFNCNPKCCCCQSYGLTKVTLECDRNFVFTGDTINVNVAVDNTKSSEKIGNVIVSLIHKRIMVSSGGRTRNLNDQNYILYNRVTRKGNPIKPGDNELISFSAQIPSTIVHYTAIGAITSSYFMLTATSQQGCCNYSPPGGSIHLVLHSRNPSVTTVSKKIQPPLGWNPLVAQKVIYNNMAPFVHRPVEQIHIKNLPGSYNALLIKEKNGMNHYEDGPSQQGITPNYDQPKDSGYRMY